MAEFRIFIYILPYGTQYCAAENNSYLHYVTSIRNTHVTHRTYTTTMPLHPVANSGAQVVPRQTPKYD